MMVACGGGGGGAGSADPGPGPATGRPGADYFPLAAGDRWVYREAGATASARVTGTRVAQGVNAVVVRVDDASGSAEALYNKTSTGVLLLPFEGADAIDRALATVPVLRLPIVAGSSEVALNQDFPGIADFDGDRRPDALTLRVETSVIGFETLVTAAGTLTDVARTRIVLTAIVTLTSTGQTVQTTTTSDDWFAPDIGPVRNVTTTTGSGTSGSEYNLIAYRVGTRRSETTAPTVASVTPADGSLVQSASMRVRFSEAMDRLAGGDYGFTLTGPDGRAVAGNVVWADDTTFDFQPAAPLTTGRYSADLAAVAEDLAGNALGAARAWTFTIDAIGPQVSATSPVAGAANVPLDSVITLTFDEDLDPATVNGDTFSLLDTLATRLILTNVSLSGRTVTLTPAAPLQRAGRYFVSVNSGLKDVYGNRFAGYSLEFSADPGRFAAPTMIPGLGSFVQALAIGDLDGDGRRDLAAVSAGIGMEPVQLRVLYQQPNGTLAAPVAMDGGLACAPQAVLAADVDGDGRTDLVVGGGCGLAVLRQGSDGRMSPQVLTTGQSTLLAVVPQAADGRMSILTQGVVGNVEHWRQTGQGLFTATAAFPQAMNNTNSAAVADFDGDGRADIVLSGLLASSNGGGLAVLYQQADGSFGRVRELPPTLDLAVNDVAAGDLNGDGRPDIVFSTGGNAPTYIGLVMQRADGSFAPMSSMGTYDIPHAVLVADVTGDGRVDVLVSHLGWLAVGIYVQAADGTLAAEQRFEAPYGCPSLDSLAVGDLDSDGLADIAYCDAVLRQRPQPAVGAAVGGGAQGLWLRSLSTPARR